MPQNPHAKTANKIIPTMKRFHLGGSSISLTIYVYNQFIPKTVNTNKARIPAPTKVPNILSPILAQI